jgi:hypothetical protein
MIEYRVISKNDAQWLGNAASVAGGFVAVVGPRLSVGTLRHRLDGRPHPSDNAVHVAMPTHFAREYCIATNGVEYLLMCVPADGPLCEMGQHVPESVVAEWIADSSEMFRGGIIDADYVEMITAMSSQSV